MNSRKREAQRNINKKQKRQNVKWEKTKKTIFSCSKLELLIRGVYVLSKTVHQFDIQLQLMLDNGCLQVFHFIFFFFFCTWLWAMKIHLLKFIKCLLRGFIFLTFYFLHWMLFIYKLLLIFGFLPFLIYNR